jgi:hypothetical protein
MYIGDFYQGIKQGHGEFFWTDNSRYRGTFDQNMLDGYGIAIIEIKYLL